MSDKIKFDDYSFIFSFLFEISKKKEITQDEYSKIKTEFINRNPEILLLYEKSKNDNHLNLLDRLKNYLNPTYSIHKNLSLPESPPEKMNQSLEKSSPDDDDKKDHNTKPSFNRKPAKFFTQLESGNNSNFLKFFSIILFQILLQSKRTKLITLKRKKYLIINRFF